MKWSEVADSCGRVVHAGMQWDKISAPVTGAQCFDSPPREPEIGQMSPHLRAVLAQLLRSHTRAEKIWMCFWEGFAGMSDVLGQAARVTLPNRTYYLVSADLMALREGQLFTEGSGFAMTPNIWWPDDHSWCVSTEIDFRFTLVGCSVQCMDELIAEPRLEVFQVDISDRADIGSDHINR
ncbi:MAG: hypothetical protein ACT4O1_16420 [Gemmatimonadota bacterium]